MKNFLAKRSCENTYGERNECFDFMERKEKCRPYLIHENRGFDAIRFDDRSPRFPPSSLFSLFSFENGALPKTLPKIGEERKKLENWRISCTIFCVKNRDREGSSRCIPSFKVTKRGASLDPEISDN